MHTLFGTGTLITAKQSKANLRKRYRQQRQDLSADKKHQAAINIAQQLLKLPAYQQAKHIGVYSALPEEASLEVFSELAWEDEKSLYLPIINKTNSLKQMHFQSWDPEDNLSTNSLGISEPKSSEADPAYPSLDLLLLPLVAYDKHGHRLGMGGGFYDRYIESHLNDNCVRIGIAFSCQEANQLDPEEWDKDLHAIVNEKELLSFI